MVTVRRSTWRPPTAPRCRMSGAGSMPTAPSMGFIVRCPVMIRPTSSRAANGASWPDRCARRGSRKRKQRPRRCRTRRATTRPRPGSPPGDRRSSSHCLKDEIGFLRLQWEKRMLARFAGALAIVVGAVTFTQPVGAQPYPNRPVRLVIAFPAGGSIDTLGRILAGKLTEEWGQNVVVENRPGAGGNIGAAAAAQAAPDGYTLHLGAQTLAVNVTIAPHQGFDPIRDLEPIMLVATAQDVLMVAPTAPYRVVQDLVTDAKARPDQLNYASLGPGSSAHLASVLFAQVAGIKLQHIP